MITQRSHKLYSKLWRTYISKNSNAGYAAYAYFSTKSNLYLPEGRAEHHGKKERAARKLISDIRKKLGKLKSEFVTVQEFCSHTGLKKEDVFQFLIH